MNTRYLSVLTAIFSSMHFFASAQAILPDTACLNTAVVLSAPANNTYYSWQLNTTAANVDINTLPVSVAALNASVNASWATIQRDQSGNWYGFYTYFPSGTVHKLSFGSSPLNTPVDNAIGSFNTTGIIQGIDIVYDKDNNKWFGFVVGGTNLIALDFGNSLANTPTSTLYNYPQTFSFPHQIGVRKFGTDWVGFIADRNGSIVRLDFPSGLNSQPAATNLPTANYSNPCNFALYQSNGMWYMIVPSLLNSNTIALLNFGSNIKNNLPTSKLIGGEISNIFIPRSLNLFSNCSNNQLYLYITNEGGGFVKLNFNGQITNNVAATNLGTFPDGGGVMTNFVYNDIVYGLKVSSNGTIGRVNMFGLPQGTETKYADETLTHSFNQTGQASLNVMVDPGLVMGTSSYCEQIFVEDCSATSINDLTANTVLMDQNFPNPSNGLTTIRFYVDGKFKNKTIVLKDLSGRIIHAYNLTEGEDHIKIDVASLQQGLYYYSLVIDGKIMSTKKMVIEQ
jgi:hypothetical protein